MERTLDEIHQFGGGRTIRWGAETLDAQPFQFFIFSNCNVLMTAHGVFGALNPIQ